MISPIFPYKKPILFQKATDIHRKAIFFSANIFELMACTLLNQELRAAIHTPEAVAAASSSDLLF